MVQGMRKSLNIPDMEPDEWEMANEDKQCDQHFQELMDTCKIPPDLQDHLIHEGFTDSGIFAFAFSKPEKFEDYLVNFVAKNSLDDSWLHSPAASSLRFLFHRTSQEMKSSPPKSRTQEAPSSSTVDGLLDLAWADLPPSRVKEADILTMKRNFLAKYPSECLDSTSMPCSRYIAQIVQQKNRTSFSWIPWKEIISESRWIELQEKGKKRQKLEGIILYDAAIDLDEDELSGAPFFIQTLLGTRAVAFALTGLCHLSQGKKYISAFMKLYTQRSNDASLRPPNMKEAQSADREFWSETFRLVNEDPDSWSMESAMIEVLTVRNFLNIHLMQRPKSVPKGHGYIWKGGKGKQKGKGKGKGKGKPKSDNFIKKDYSQKFSWPSNWATKNGKGQNFCHRYHVFQSCSSTSCRFSHECPVLVNGKPCGKAHAAKDHKN